MPLKYTSLNEFIQLFPNPDFEDVNEIIFCCPDTPYYIYYTELGSSILVTDISNIDPNSQAKPSHIIGH